MLQFRMALVVLHVEDWLFVSNTILVECFLAPPKAVGGATSISEPIECLTKLVSKNKV